MSDWTDDDRARFDEAKRIIKSGDVEAMVEHLKSGRDCVTHHYCDCTAERIKRLHATLDNHEQLIDRLRSERNRSREALAVSREHCIEQGRRIEDLQDERDRLRLSVSMAHADYDEVLDRANQYRRALERIADTNPDPRQDGTYNISREALIQIAARALNDVNNLYHSGLEAKDSLHE